MACIPCMVGVASAGPLAPIAAVGATAYYLTKKSGKREKKDKGKNKRKYKKGDKGKNKRGNNKRSNK